MNPALGFRGYGLGFRNLGFRVQGSCRHPCQAVFKEVLNTKTYEAVPFISVQVSYTARKMLCVGLECYAPNPKDASTQ